MHVQSLVLNQGCTLKPGDFILTLSKDKLIDLSVEATRWNMTCEECLQYILRWGFTQYFKE